MTCPLCSADPHPTDYASPRNCAFKTDTFSRDNWSCLTMWSLRDRCIWTMRDDDSAGSIGVIPIPDDILLCGGSSKFYSQQGYLVMTWYKDRGATPGAFVLDDEGHISRLTLDLANELIRKVKPRERDAEADALRSAMLGAVVAMACGGVEE